MSYVPPFVCQKASNATMMDVKIGHMAILIQVHEDSMKTFQLVALES